jgi:hypothetical protein
VDPDVPNNVVPFIYYTARVSIISRMRHFLYQKQQVIYMISFEQDGAYNLTLEACNWKEGCVRSIVYPLKVSGKITGLTIDDYGVIIPPVTKITFQDISDESKYVSFITNLYFFF